MTEQPKQREDGRWDAIGEDGYGHVLGYSTREEVEAWLEGYQTGAMENR